MSEKDVAAKVLNLFDNDDFCEEGVSCGECKSCKFYNELVELIR